MTGDKPQIYFILKGSAIYLKANRVQPDVLFALLGRSQATGTFLGSIDTSSSKHRKLMIIINLKIGFGIVSLLKFVIEGLW